LTPLTINMYEWCIIVYRIWLKGLPIPWRSLITLWQPPALPSCPEGVSASTARFVDEQVKGPYQKWHHDHTFEAVAEGTRCIDTVHYRVPFDGLVHGLFVQPDLKKIFNYRTQVIREMFGTPQPELPRQAG